MCFLTLVFCSAADLKKEQAAIKKVQQEERAASTTVKKANRALAAVSEKVGEDLAEAEDLEQRVATWHSDKERLEGEVAEHRADDAAAKEELQQLEVRRKSELPPSRALSVAPLFLPFSRKEGQREAGKMMGRTTLTYLPLFFYFRSFALSLFRP